MNLNLCGLRSWRRVQNGVLYTLLVLGFFCIEALPIQALPDESPQWSISVLTGKHPTKLTEPLYIHNPILTASDVTDRRAEFVADPFLFRHKGLWYLFFEIMLKEGHGDIGFAVSRDGFHWKYQSVVLDEPFHLSYPFVFEHQGSIYMMPETRKTQSIRLYRAARFPRGWHHVKTLVRGNYADPSPFKYKDKWWMFAVEGGYSLVLFHADSLFGKWNPHYLNPIYRNEKWRSRPAGRPLVEEDSVIRFAQDNQESYGRQVRAFLVSKLSETHFEETEFDSSPVIQPKGDAWRANGMHHIDAWQKTTDEWIAVVDGSGWPSKSFSNFEQ